MKRVGIIGCGGIAGTHAWALSKMADVELAAFADILPERAQSFSEKYTDGKAAVYSDLTKMLREAGLDVVHICTPHYLHVPMAIEALQAGVSVFSEKPPAINMEQFEQLRHADNTTSAKLGFCFQNRYNQSILKADELLAEGRLGKVVGARAFVTWRREADYYATDWKGVLATEGGGALINQSIHTLDLMLRFLGEPVSVQASISNHHLQGVIEVEDTVDARMTFADGAIGCFYATTGYATDAPVILELTCEKGSLTLVDKTVTVREAGADPVLLTLEEAAGVGKSYWGNGHLTCICDFYEKLDSGERFQNDLQGVENTMKTMMQIYAFR